VQLFVPRVKGGVYANPSAVIVGPIPIGSRPTTQIVDLYDCGVSGRKVGEVSTTHPKQFRVRMLPLRDDELLKSHPTAGKLIGRLEVTVLADQRGPLDGEVEIRLSNEKRPPDRIRVVGEVVGAVDCWPPQLVIPGRVGAKRDFHAEVLVLSRDGKPIQVTVESVPLGLSAIVRATAERPNEAILVIKHPATAAAVRPSPDRQSRVALRVIHDGKQIKKDVIVTTWDGPS
jgi:hypothetical protein